MPRVFISDSTEGGTHGNDVRAAILANHPDLVSGDITLQLNATYNITDILNDFDTAFNGGYEAFVCSANVEPSMIINRATELNVQSDLFRIFLPIGRNEHVQVVWDPDRRFSTILCGASDGSDNETGYGNSLWFFDDDNGAVGDLTSFSTGVIAGKLLYIKDQRGGDWNDAVYSAAKTASMGGTATFNNGYGIINVASAIAYSYSGEKILSGSLEYNIATLECGAGVDSVSFYLEKNVGAGWQAESNNTTGTFTVTVTDNSATQFRYRVFWEGQYSDYSNTVTLTFASTVRASNNFKFAGQTDVTLSELGKTLGEYSDIVGGTNVEITVAERIVVDLITYLKAINEGTTYRNTPQYVGKVALDPLKRTVHPAIYVNIGDSVLRPHDDIATAYYEDFQVNVIGYVKNRTDMQHAGNLSDLLEGLLQDCLKALLPQMTANINSTRWHINIHRQPIAINRVLDIEQNVGEFVITFMATAFAMDNTRVMQGTSGITIVGGRPEIRSKRVSVSAGLNSITFTSNLNVTYNIISLRCYDSSGGNIEIALIDTSAEGFSVYCPAAGTLVYVAMEEV